MSEFLLSLLTVEFFLAVIRMATPIALAATGEVCNERSGVLNVGIEGMMLIGAFFAVVGSALSQNAFVGVLTAMLASLLTAFIFSIIVITLKANQIVAGFALNIAALGITDFLNRVIFGIRSIPIQVPGINPIDIPLLSKIPIIGPVLFQNNLIVYFTYLIVPAVYFIIFKTTVGLKIRSVGENPRAADMVGINVYFWRYSTTLLNGMLCGIAGAALSLANVNTFVTNITAGRGFIALAAVIFGRWNPILASLAALLFGTAQALALRFQAFGVAIPSQFLIMLPYALSLIGIIIFRGRASNPAALTNPYNKEAV